MPPELNLTVAQRRVLLAVAEHQRLRINDAGTKRKYDIGESSGTRCHDVPRIVAELVSRDLLRRQLGDADVWYRLTEAGAAVLGRAA